MSCMYKSDHRLLMLTSAVIDERIQPPFTLPTAATQVRSKPTKPPLGTRSTTTSTSSRSGTGTTQMAFNTSGSLLLVRSASCPTAVLLYDFPHAAFSSSHSAGRSASATTSSSPSSIPRLRTVLLHTQPVTSTRWNPDPERAGRLAVVCGSQSVYLWSDEWVVEPEAPGASHPGPGLEEDAEVAECVGVPARKFLLFSECVAVTDSDRRTEKFEARDLKWAPDGKGMILLDRETFCCAFDVEEEGQDDADMAA